MLSAGLEKPLKVLGKIFLYKISSEINKILGEIKKIPVYLGILDI